MMELEALKCLMSCKALKSLRARIRILVRGLTYSVGARSDSSALNNFRMSLLVVVSTESSEGEVSLCFL